MSAKVTLPLDRGIACWIALTETIAATTLAVLWFSGPMAAGWSGSGWVFGTSLVIALWFARIAWRRRPSDLTLSEAGIQIRGGPAGGTRYEWDALRDPALRLFNDRGAVALFLERKQGKHVRLAEEPTLDESGGLPVLVESCTPRSWRPGGLVDRPIAPYVIRCRECAEPVPTEDVPECVCGAPLSLPSELAQRLQTLKQSEDSRAAHLFDAMVQRARAAPASVVLVLSTLCAIAFLLGVALTAPRLDGPAGRLAQLALVATAAALAGVAMAIPRILLVDRELLRSIIVGFGARTLEREDRRFGCRVCGGCLPPGLIVRCVYCSTENLCGFDLRLQDSAELEQYDSISQAMAHRRTQRYIFGTVAFGFLMLALAAILFSVRV